VNETRSTCCYCGTGCGVVIESAQGRVTGVRGDPAHPSSRGRLCSKGTTLHLTMQPAALAGRARHPEMRFVRGEPRQRTTWDAALDHVAERFRRIVEEHGPDAVAFYISGQLLTEDYYAFNKLAKGVIGTANVDTNSRLCMSSAVAGYTKTLGVDAPPSCYDDIEQATCLFIAGSNTAYAHPVLMRRIEAAKEANPAMRIVVVDPRRTETARFADLHLAILPGTDVALFHGMLHVMLWERLVEEAFVAAHTSGFEALRELARGYSPQAVAAACGVRAEDIVTAARWFAGSGAGAGNRGAGRTLSLYCQGLNQSSSGTAKNATLVNLHLATGQIGKPGAGPFSLTGQPNAMGGREVGGLATTLAAHRSLEEPAHREEMARLWDVPVERIPRKAGLTAVELFDALAAGTVKAVWIACTNPMQSMPDLARVRAALEAAELVVLQEAYANTETAPFADVLLPATSWGEKDGTVTNSERRISRVRPAVPPPGEARHDWQIACDFARRWVRQREGAEPSCAEELWNEHREATRGRDLDITGLSYAILEERGPQQWPFPEGATEGRARLYTDGRFETPDGRARFFVEKHRPTAEIVDAKYPLRLTTGRMRDHWHGMSRTATVPALFGHVPEPRLGMNPHDLARRGIAEGDLVRVESRRGAIHVLVAADEDVRSGQAYLPMHWGRRFLGGRGSAGTNTLTSPAFDPHSRQPELKHAAIKVSAASFPWHLVAFAEVPAAALDAIALLQDGVAFYSAVPIGRERTGILVRAAAAGAPHAAWLDAFDRALGLEGEDLLRYDDPRRGTARRLRVRDDRLAAARLSGPRDTLAGADTLREWVLADADVAPIRRLLLQNPDRIPNPGTDPAAPGCVARIVCQCFGVDESSIVATLETIQGDTATRVKAVKDSLQCGTNCGSCLPDLRRLAEASKPEAGRMVA
jgi:assimilatory nitrate reductase catalytic subunit